MKKTKDEFRRILNSKNTVFHYTTAMTLFEHILPTNKIRMSMSKNTNDPYESNKYYFHGNFKNVELPGQNRANLLGLLNNQFDLIRRNFSKLLCLSKNTNKIEGYFKSRMWAQYGDNNKGVCLAFNKTNLINALKNEIEVLNHKCITYVDIFNHEDYTFNISTKDLNNDPYQVAYKKFIEKLEIIFLKKLQDFKDEDEYRIIGFNKSEQDEDLEYKDSLIAIIVGDRFPDGLLPSLQFFCKNKNIPSFKCYWNKNIRILADCYPNNIHLQYENEYKELKFKDLNYML